MSRSTSQRDRVIAVVGLAAAGALLLFAAATGRWALAGAPLGFALGFVLAKGDLCSAASFSETLVLRSGRKLLGLWVAAVTCMVVFALLEAAGLVEIRPRPLAWASYAAGGALFGVGMVLCGGCVSGTLYKCGVGHANAPVALLAIPAGILLVDLGPLAGWRDALASHVLDGPGGAPVTLATLTGLPHAVLAGLFAIATAALSIRLRRRRLPPAGATPTAPVSLATRVLARRWSPVTAGLAVGLLSAPVWLTSAASGRDFPLCVTYGVEEIALLASPAGVDMVRSPADLHEGPADGGRPRVYLWLVLFAACVVPGAHVAARLSGGVRWMRRPLDLLVAAAAGGLLVGAGAGLAQGCMLGNGISGTGMMSVGMMLFAVVAAAANLATTRWWLLGGM